MDASLTVSFSKEGPEGLCLFERLLTYCVLCTILLYFILVEPKNDQFFFEKSITKILFKIKVKFSPCNTEDTKTLIIPIYYM